MAANDEIEKKTIKLEVDAKQARETVDALGKQEIGRAHV